MNKSFWHSLIMTSLFSLINFNYKTFIEFWLEARELKKRAHHVISLRIFASFFR